MSDTVYFVAAVSAIIFKENRVLAMKRSEKKDAGAGLWETLSGRINENEEPLEAIAREIQEECGLQVKIDSRPFTTYYSRRKGKPMILIVYCAEYVSGEVIRSEEHDEYAWLTPDEFAQISSLEKLVDTVYQAAKHYGRY